MLVFAVGAVITLGPVRKVGQLRLWEGSWSITARTDSGAVVWADGRRLGPWAGAGVSQLGWTWALWRLGRGGYYAVVDDVEVGPFDALDGPWLGAGGRYGFVGWRGGEALLVVDGDTLGTFQGAWGPSFAEGSWAALIKQGREYWVLGPWGRSGPYRDAVEAAPAVSGSAWGILLEDGSLILNGRRVGRWPALDWDLRLSGSHWSLLVRGERKSRLVVDGREVASIGVDEGFALTPEGSWALWGRDGEGAFLITPEGRRGPYPGIVDARWIRGLGWCCIVIKGDEFFVSTPKGDRGPLASGLEWSLGFCEDGRVVAARTLMAGDTLRVELRELWSPEVAE